MVTLRNNPLQLIQILNANRITPITGKQLLDEIGSGYIDKNNPVTGKQLTCFSIYGWIFWNNPHNGETTLSFSILVSKLLE